jgi:leucyl aminopeptidase
MKLNVYNVLDVKSEVLVLGLFDEQKLYDKENPELSKELNEAIKSKLFEREFANTYTTRFNNSIYKSILVISLGKDKDFTFDTARVAMSLIIEHLRKNKYKSFTTNIASLVDADSMMLGSAFAEGLILADYSFDKYKSKKDDKPKISASIMLDDPKKKLFISGFNTGSIIANATNYSKDLVNEPAIVMTPEAIELEAKKLSKHSKMKVKVMEKSEMKKKGLNLLLAVSSGSTQNPKLIFIEYNGAGSNSKEKYSAIIGKGIAFDSGGYDIKSSGQFADMKCDMAGAAAVLGTLKAAAELGLKKNILGVIPTCENLINGSAYKPGDILKAYNGKTVEIDNTDAEGRLILADAIAYTEKNYAPEIIIDLATLTGACIVALGFYYAGLFTNDKMLGDKLLAAGVTSNDRLWKMPFDKDYHDLMDGDISDLKNMSRWTAHKGAGSITGAVFISKFLDLEKTKWAHLDIASTAFIPEARYYNQKYATGAGVRLLSYYFKE